MVWVDCAPVELCDVAMLVAWMLTCDRAGMVRCEYLYSLGCAGYGTAQSPMSCEAEFDIDKQLVRSGFCNAHSRGSILVDPLFRWRQVQEPFELSDRVYQHTRSDRRHVLGGL